MRARREDILRELGLIPLWRTNENYQVSHQRHQARLLTQRMIGVYKFYIWTGLSSRQAWPDVPPVHCARPAPRQCLALVKRMPIGYV